MAIKQPFPQSLWERYTLTNHVMSIQSVTFPQALWEWLFDSRSHKACGNDVVLLYHSIPVYKGCWYEFFHKGCGNAVFIKYTIT